MRSNYPASSWRTSAGSGSRACMTRHVDSGEPLPRALFDKMLAAKKLPERVADAAPDRVLAVRHADAQQFRRAATRASCSCSTRLPRSRVLIRRLQPFPAQLLHIFSGGYAAGYYSYKWARCCRRRLQLFEEHGVLNPDVGALPCEILAMGAPRRDGLVTAFPAGSPASMRCCGTTGWPETRQWKR